MSNPTNKPQEARFRARSKRATRWLIAHLKASLTYARHVKSNIKDATIGQLHNYIAELQHNLDQVLMDASMLQQYDTELVKLMEPTATPAEMEEPSDPSKI